jgi:OmpA-OmpF porin, OOP family
LFEQAARVSTQQISASFLVNQAGSFMNIRRQSVLWRQFFLLLVFSFMFSVTLHPSGASAAETTVEEMIGTLSKKNTAEPGAVRMRSIGGNKSSTTAGQLQLSVQFDLGSANISPTSRELLTKLGAAMNSPALAGQRFRIEGHTDATGDADTNQRLSARRAQSVQTFLEANSGIETNRLSAVGKGSSEPIDAANPKAAVNRRVMVAVIESVATMPAPPAGEAAASAASAAPVAGAAIPNANVAGAGIVMQVRGEVTVIRAGGSVKLAEGDNIREGDTISTPVGASVLLQLSDDAKLLVRAGTTVRLTQIVNDGPVEKRSQLVELTLGALRYVTGALGKLQPQSVRFKTPTASVGIRGTDIDIVYTIATRSLQPAGTYVRVNTGAVDLNGSDGSVVALNVNEQATAAPEGPRLRGGGRGPAAKKLEQPVTLFQADELDSLLNGR